MCGRFSLIDGINNLFKSFGMPPIPMFSPRYNIAPSQPVLAIINDTDLSKIRHDFFTWGLVPSWADDPKIGFNMINARVETIKEKPSFKNPFKYRRCIVPASGFYEWKSVKGQKLPYYFQSKNKTPLLFAALWEVWYGKGGEELRTCAIITSKANKDVSFLHDRMPLMLDIDTGKRWMSNEFKPDLKAIVANSFKTPLLSYPVSKIVNSPKVDTSDCIVEVNDKHPVQLTFF